MREDIKRPRKQIGRDCHIVVEKVNDLTNSVGQSYVARVRRRSRFGDYQPNPWIRSSEPPQEVLRWRIGTIADDEDLSRFRYRCGCNALETFPQAREATMSRNHYRK